MGVSQVGYLGKQVVKMLLKAVRYLFSSIFNADNIIKPLRFLAKLLLGTDFSKKSAQEQMMH